MKIMTEIKYIASYLQKIITPLLFISLIFGGINIFVYGGMYDITSYIIKNISINQIVFISCYTFFKLYLLSYFSAFCLFTFFLVFFRISFSLKKCLITKRMLSKKYYSNIALFSVIPFLLFTLSFVFEYYRVNSENFNVLLWCVFSGSFINILYFIVIINNIDKKYLFYVFILLPPFSMLGLMASIPPQIENTFTSLSYASSSNDILLTTEKEYREIDNIFSQQNIKIRSCIYSNLSNYKIASDNIHIAWDDNEKFIFISQLNKKQRVTAKVNSKEFLLIKNANNYSKKNFYGYNLEKCQKT